MMAHIEHHKTHRSGWLRAAVLGANDGIVSTSSLIIGVAISGASRESILLAGTAGMVAGAMSMAAGEYISVKSQEDTEDADLKMEAISLINNRKEEEQELAIIYMKRGLDKKLAYEVSRQLMEHNALEAHARDEIGITPELRAFPLQAAYSSAAAFTVGAAIPVISIFVLSIEYLPWVIPILSIALLGVLGVIAAIAGGASPIRGAIRSCFWGMLAMIVTAAVGKLLGTFG